MEPQESKRIIEGILFVFGQPVALKRLSETLPEVSPAAIREAVEALNAEYAQTGRAFHVQEVAGGYQLVTDQQLATWIKRALNPPKPDAVSTAALETLAIIAYRQPITKAEIEAIRGVDATAALDTLIERRFVRTAGRKESPGRPFLYGTTAEFLRHFGLKSLETLPRLQLPSLQEPSTEPAPSEPQPAVEAPASSGAVDGS